MISSKFNDPNLLELDNTDIYELVGIKFWKYCVLVLCSVFSGGARDSNLTLQTQNKQPRRAVLRLPRKMAVEIILSQNFVKKWGNKERPLICFSFISVGVKSNKVFSNCLNQKIYVIQWLKVSGSFSETKTIFCWFVAVVDTVAHSYVLKIIWSLRFCRWNGFQTQT
jgi:hypothetical protein